MHSRAPRTRCASMRLHSVFSAVRCTRCAYQVEPISTRLYVASMFEGRRPAIRPPASTPRTVSASNRPAAASRRRRSPPPCLRARGSRCTTAARARRRTRVDERLPPPRARGSSVAWTPLSVTGSASSRLRLRCEPPPTTPARRVHRSSLRPDQRAAVMSLRHQPAATVDRRLLLIGCAAARRRASQRDTSLVLQQRADERRHADLVVPFAAPRAGCPRRRGA